MTEIKIQNNKNEKAIDNNATIPVQFLQPNSGEFGAYYDLRVEYANSGKTANAFIGMGQDVWSFLDPSKFPIPGYPKSASAVSGSESIKFTYRYSPGSLTNLSDSGKTDITSSFILDIWLGKRGTDEIDGDGKKIYKESFVIDVHFAKYVPIDFKWNKEFQSNRKLRDDFERDEENNLTLYQIGLMEQDLAPAMSDSTECVSQRIYLRKQIDDAFKAYYKKRLLRDDYDITGIEIGAEIVPLNNKEANHSSSIGIPVAEFSFALHRYHKDLLYDDYQNGYTFGQKK